MSRVFDLLCVRSYDFILWWFDMDFILYDFVLDFVLCVSVVFVFVLSFFIRVFLSFYCVTLVVSNQIKFFLHGVCFCFAYFLFTFIGFMFSMGILWVLYLVEICFWLLCVMFIDFVSYSSVVCFFPSVPFVVSVIYCGFLFILFYFILLYFFSFVFFIVRCLFIVVCMYMAMNADICVSIVGWYNSYFDFIVYIIMYFTYVYCYMLGYFSYVLVLSFNFMVVYYSVVVFFSYMFLLAKAVTYCVNSVFWVIFKYTRVCDICVECAVLFYKIMGVDIYFLYILTMVLLFISYFSFFVKDFVVVTFYFDILISGIIYDILACQAFTSNVCNTYLTQLVCMCV